MTLAFAVKGPLNFSAFGPALLLANWKSVPLSADELLLRRALNRKNVIV